jgi:hypothetical protein
LSFDTDFVYRHRAVVAWGYAGKDA